MALANAVLALLRRYGAPCEIHSLTKADDRVTSLGYLSVLRQQDRHLTGETLSRMGVSDTHRYLLITPPLDTLPRLTGDHRVLIHGEQFHPLSSEPIRLAGKTVYLRTVLERLIEQEAPVWTH